MSTTRTAATDEHVSRPSSPGLSTQPGRADLVHALVHRGEAGLGELAELLGYAERERPTKVVGGKGVKRTTMPEPDDREDEAVDLPIPFWRLARLEYFDAEEDGRLEMSAPASTTATPLEAGNLPVRPGKRAAPAPIVSAASLRAGFDRMLESRLASRRLDIDAVVDDLGRGRSLRHLPCLWTSGWNPRLLIVVDRSRRLIPYWNDQSRLVASLIDQLGASRVRVYGWVDSFGGAWRDARGQRTTVPRAQDGEAVLALSDLGFLGGYRARVTWMRWARVIGARASRVAALVPVPVERWQPSVAAAWDAADWSAPHRAVRAGVHNAADLEQRCHGLLTLASIAAEIQPGLLRDLRKLLSPDADLATEADVWSHPDLERFLPSGGQLDTAAQRRWRQRFARLSRDLKRDAVKTLRRWRDGMRAEIWWQEVLALAGDDDVADLIQDDLEQAAQFLGQAVVTSRSEGPTTFAEEILAWIRRSGLRLPGDGAWRDSASGATMREAWDVAWRRVGEAPIPSGMGPSPTEGEVASWHLDQQGDDLILTRDAEAVRTPIGILPAIDSVKVGDDLAPAVSLQPTTRLALPESPALMLHTGHAVAALERVERPTWADAMGRDRFGLWTRFTVGDASQRLRWIPPGRFMMGSPEDEPGRYEDEGPRHEVMVHRGFWLADTPCTQAMWQVVMGDNPSRFVSFDRPVERVSWDDCRTFLAELNDHRPGLEARLPREAEWEYACRAGTETATYAGPIEILGRNNAPILDEIAWYGGNSDVDFELDNGVDATWREKQYLDTEKAGTHPVASKSPNAWGLYDTLGNVREWCHDRWSSHYDSPRMDTGRVVRGGSWVSVARNVRAAYRFHYEPSDRFYNLGFRLALGQVSVGQEAEREDARRPNGGPRRRRSRREGPAWATASDNDEYSSRWATLDVEGVEQRMRWIPPGRFLMGSPEDEPGRYDDEGPQHLEVIEQGFWLADTPCTQALWQVVTGENPSKFKAPQRPVEGVSWADCQTFLKALDERFHGFGARLPTEAEWEYACRAGTKSVRYGDLEQVAWFTGNSDSRTHDVGRKQGNAWGIHDMLGNVHEWCHDRWCDDYDSPRKDTSRVVRGGSWYNLARYVRAAYRIHLEPSFRSSHLGFRLALGQVSSGSGAEPRGAERSAGGAGRRFRDQGSGQP